MLNTCGRTAHNLGIVLCSTLRVLHTYFFTPTVCAQTPGTTHSNELLLPSLSPNFLGRSSLLLFDCTHFPQSLLLKLLIYKER